ncbi:hypothetical protein OSB04_002463 [Centaurea solstitialis]|uniref:Uncharacterized protein n=1 Tax=Centaurea solstitialis TaxID=347529 RepID=A0AA38WMT9_9ASTR|nr:hypothetical protein OSB04_002463 [Centaurea solstitialis]
MFNPVHDELTEFGLLALIGLNRFDRRLDLCHIGLELLNLSLMSIETALFGTGGRWHCEDPAEFSLIYICFLKKGYHRDILEHWSPPPPPPLLVAASSPPTPSIPINRTPKITVINLTKVPTVRHRRDRKSRRHRKAASGTGDN